MVKISVFMQFCVCVCVCVCADVTCEYDGDELSLGESVTDSDDGCTRW